MSCRSTIRLNYDLLEDRCTDVTIDNILLFYHIQQIGFHVAMGLSSNRSQEMSNMFGTSLTHSVAPRVLLFLVLPNFDPTCELTH